MNEPLTNIPEYTVSEISGAVKRTLEGAFGRVRVRGEITDYKLYSSGHVYFSLKDEGGKISGVVWKSTVARLGLVPENGVEVIATGRISAYGERSSYQLTVEKMEYAGVGALLARIDMLRVRLAAEGLFGAERKRALPVLPAVIGVVTSAQGAVLQDIKTTILRRFPRPILVWPVPVQGEGAAERIAAAIVGFGRLPHGTIPRPDVLIVARGGGSLEDLMAFNEEIVVRAAAACPIPLISAVGHETDHTLIDLAADRRAPTPTAAAELAVPSRAALAATVAGEATRLTAGLRRVTQERHFRLGRAERGLPDLTAMMRAVHLAVEGRAGRLRLALPNLMAARHAALARAGQSLPHPSGVLHRQRASLALSASQLVGGLRHAAQFRRASGARVLARLSPAPLQSTLREARGRLESAAARLLSVSPDGVLARGYVLVTGPDGHPLVSAHALHPGLPLRLRFGDGTASAQVV